jgi:SAM-dependent methyltransferase
VSDPSREVKARLAKAYDDISLALPTRRRGGWRWLHAGVAPAEGPEEVIETPLRWGPVNADHARLTAELIGHTPLDGADLVEVGCGRGGNLMACARWFDLRRCVGLDLSGAAVAAVADALGDRGVRAVHGDAEALPFTDDAVDALLCVESAGHYPNRLTFFSEAARIVRPGGWLLYAESLDEPTLGAVQRALGHCGFDLTFHADVGPRVRRHWASVSASPAGRRARAAMADDERDVVGPGGASELGRLLSDGQAGYHLMRWRRADRAVDLAAVAAADRRRVDPGGDGAAAIIESYGRGSWVRAVRG